MVKIEYLLPFNTEDGICKDIESFNSLLCSHSDITVKDKKIKFRGSSYSYEVDMNVVLNQEYTVFHVSFEINHITDKFRDMLKAFKKIVGVFLKDDLQIIWDGIGFEWSKELYPKIYKIENLMRKLISKFMLINLGVGWYKSAVPSEVKESIKSPNAKVKHGILYEVDFIQLSHFLFKKYAFKDATKLPNVISEALDGEMTDEKRNEILDFIPKNNWDRYLSEVVECESEQLKKKWTKLYDIRCKVAHNKSLEIAEFEEGSELCEFLEPILQSAFESLNNIQIPEEEKENISLNTIATVHEPTRAFINDYNNFKIGLNGLIANNEGIFNVTNQYASPINTFLDSSDLGQINISESLKETLGSIELTKNNLLASESITSLSALTNNYGNLFNEATEGIITGLEGIKISSETSKFFEKHNYWWNQEEEDKKKRQ